LTLNRHFDPINEETLKNLLEAHHNPAISLFMPTHPAGSEQDTIRLKNLRKEATAVLESDGLNYHEIEELFKPLEPLMDKSHEFWNYQSSGLALFLADGIFEHYRLPLEFSERAIVNERFYIKPLIPMLSYDSAFALLALDLSDVKLFQGTPGNLAEVHLESMPTSLQEALKYTEIEKNLQSRSGAGRTEATGQHGAIYHGHAEGVDDAEHKERVLEYFRHLDNGVRDWLADQEIPLLIAGVEYISALYKKANHYSHLVDNVLDLNPSPKAISLDQLHTRAMDVMSPIFAKKREHATARFKQLRGQSDPHVSEDLNVVVPASFYQQIDTLFVRKGEEKWGSFDASANKIELHEQRRKGDLCLLDFATAHALLNKGQVYLLSDEEMPTNLGAAAILRSEWTA